MSKKKKAERVSQKLMAEYQHEAGDRVYVLMTMLEAHVGGHPFIAKNRKLKKQAREATDALFGLYQDIWTTPV